MVSLVSFFNNVDHFRYRHRWIINPGNALLVLKVWGYFFKFSYRTHSKTLKDIGRHTIRWCLTFLKTNSYGQKLLFWNSYNLFPNIRQSHLIVSIDRICEVFNKTPLTCFIPRCPVGSHSLVCSKNSLLIVGIGPILNKELGLIFRSDRSDCTCVYS